ncbi:MAG: protein-tyrosine phosphatase family protein [Bdellovibrionales bacterium]
MKAFWWFEDNLLAGMARPGFNCTQWFDLPYDEAVMMGWLGQHSSGEALREDLHQHVQYYCPKIARFYGLEPEESLEIAKKYYSKSGVEAALDKLLNNTKILKSYEVTEDRIQFSFCDIRLDQEISFLKNQGIKTVVTLTEQHHNKDELSDHFDLHHFSIRDLDAPSFEQVLEFSEIIKQSKVDREPMAIHCLAGIGRTSTMLIAAHLVLGENLDQLLADLAVKNPSYKFAGSQAEFIHSVAENLKS